MADTKPPPLSEEDTASLAHQINTAIASSHTKINRLILDRMPKAVPPQTENPSTYITGLLHIGAVYIAFESLWQNLLGVHSEIAPIPYTFPFSNGSTRHDETPHITQRLRRVLEQAYWPNLLRAARIKADTQAMTGWPDHVFDEQLRSAGTTGRLGKFTLHIQESINTKPHLLLAYAYCLYLALLSGGSYIRTELIYLKAEFWSSLPTPIKPNDVECRQNKVKPRRRHSSLEDDRRARRLTTHNSSVDPPLEFLDFDPPLGENPRQQTKELKAEFKQRFAEAAQLLAEPERNDIISESITIFHHLEGVVAQLDKIFRTGAVPQQQLATPAQRALNTPSRTGGIGFRLRDSIAIAKGRLLRTRRKPSGSPVTATVPTTAEALSSQVSESSKTSSVNGEDEYMQESNKHAHPDFQDKQSNKEAPEYTLARAAAVPADGFRSIRYDGDTSKTDRCISPATDINGPLKDNRVVDNPRSFDGTASDVECCPMSLAPTSITAAVKSKAEPDYALYVIISNFVVLAGVAGIFAAYLYVRHGEGRAGIVEL